MSKNDDGATPVPVKPKDCPDANGIMHAHAFQWIWKDGEMTNRVKCMNCGLEKEHHSNASQ